MFDHIPGYCGPAVVKQSRSVVSDSLQPCGLLPARLLRPWDSPGKNNGVGSHSLLQGIFPVQGSNSGLSHCRQILYHQNHHGSPPLLTTLLTRNTVSSMKMCKEPQLWGLHLLTLLSKTLVQLVPSSDRCVKRMQPIEILPAQTTERSR